MSRRFVVLTLAVLLLCSAPALASASDSINGSRFIATGAVSDPPRLKARAWAVADLDTGRLLAVHRPRTKLPMASTIKLLTALTAARSVPADVKHRVTYDEAHPEYCTCVGLKVGRRYTREALMAATLLSSANDAAEALAGAHPLGRDLFMTAMNTLAASLGATRTHAVTPSGLTAPGAYSTVTDLLVLLRAAAADPVVAPLLARSRYRFGPINRKRNLIYRSTDYVNLYDDRWPGVVGKSGYTSASKNTLVVSTPIRGHRIGVAILGAKTGTITPSARKLTQWAVRNLDALGEVGRLP